MMNKFAMGIAATSGAIAGATPAHAAAQPAHLPDMAGWMPLIAILGLVALVIVLSLITSRLMRRHPPEPDEAEASALRIRDEKFAEELKILWDKTTTTETLRPHDEAQASDLEEKR